MALQDFPYTSVSGFAFFHEEFAWLRIWMVRSLLASISNGPISSEVDCDSVEYNMFANHYHFCRIQCTCYNVCVIMWSITDVHGPRVHSRVSQSVSTTCVVDGIR